MQPHLTTLGARLDALVMTLKDSTTIGADEWLKTDMAASLICHGAMYAVDRGSQEQPPIRPAEDAAKFLIEGQPIAVGSTPLDAILAYIYAHKDSDLGEIQELEEDITVIQELLLS